MKLDCCSNAHLITITTSAQRVQTSLAEADHYSHIMIAINPFTKEVINV